MTTYRNLSGISGVAAYEVAHQSITVVFKDRNSSVYIYTYGSAGADVIEEMKRLAGAGRGLGAYININCKRLWERRLR
jgi:hypothetical protein